VEDKERVAGSKNTIRVVKYERCCRGRRKYMWHMEGFAAG
jgi:hypothetical protein